jgi:ribosome-binding factor A
MSQDVHAQRMESELKELTARYISEVSNHQSLITVTDLVMSDAGKRATFLVSVFPEDKEKVVIDFLMRKKDECRAYIKDHSRMRILPYVAFAIDEGEKRRQKIDALLREESK